MVPERRRHARRDYAHHVLCYIDGWRLDAFTLDISQGGTFLATDHAGRIDQGALVGVVVNGEEPTANRVYVFGRVVRVATGDMPGLGVQWVRAAAIDAVEPLVRVLGELFGLTPDDVNARVTAGTGRQRYVYMFESPGAAPPLEEPTEAKPKAEAKPKTEAKPQPEVAPAAATPANRSTDAREPAAASDWPPEPQAAVAIDAVIDVRGVRIASRVVRLGARSLELDTSFVPGEGTRELGVEFRLPVRRLEVQVYCACRVVDGPAAKGRSRLRLVVVRLDEGKFPKALEQFVKWACSREAAKD